MQTYSGGFLFYGNHVAMVLKSKPRWQFGLLNCIGGAIELGETPVTAMVREFQEETQLLTMERDWTEKLVIEGEGWRVHFFAAMWYERAPLMGTKEEPVSWQLVDPLPRHVIPNLRWIVPFMLDPDIKDLPLKVYDKRGADYGKHEPK